MIDRERRRELLREISAIGQEQALSEDAWNLRRSFSHEYVRMHPDGLHERGCFGCKQERALDRIQARADVLLEAIEMIADHPTTSRNPDGDEQAAHEMRYIALLALREYGELGRPGERTRRARKGRAPCPNCKAYVIQTGRGGTCGFCDHQLPTYDEVEGWRPQCPYGDLCSGCDAGGRCAYAEVRRD